MEIQKNFVEILGIDTKNNVAITFNLVLKIAHTYDNVCKVKKKVQDYLYEITKREVDLHAIFS